MTPDLMATMSGIEDLRELILALNQHGPDYLAACVESDMQRRPARPRARNLPPNAARLVRELADDAIVRTLQGTGR